MEFVKESDYYISSEGYQTVPVKWVVPSYHGICEWEWLLYFIRDIRLFQWKELHNHSKLHYLSINFMSKSGVTFHQKGSQMFHWKRDALSLVVKFVNKGDVISHQKDSRLFYWNELCDCNKYTIQTWGLWIKMMSYFTRGIPNCSTEMSFSITTWILWTPVVSHINGSIPHSWINLIVFLPFFFSFFLFFFFFLPFLSLFHNFELYENKQLKVCHELQTANVSVQCRWLLSSLCRSYCMQQPLCGLFTSFFFLFFFFFGGGGFFLLLFYVACSVQSLDRFHH